MKDLFYACLAFVILSLIMSICTVLFLRQLDIEAANYVSPDASGSFAVHDTSLSDGPVVAASTANN